MPTILQLNIEGLTASKINVLYHLAQQLEGRVIQLQETHCIIADKLTIPSFVLDGSTLSKKHGLATFVHERVNWAMVNQSSTTYDAEWLCIDIDCQCLQTSFNQ